MFLELMELKWCQSSNCVTSFHHQDAGLYVDDMVKPVLTCFYDSDSRVRYYGCESLYNIVKVARSAVLPFFNEIFDGLGKVGVFFLIIIIPKKSGICYSSL